MISRRFIYAHHTGLSHSIPPSESLLIFKRRADIYHPDLVMNNNQVQEVDSHKHLGFVFSNDGTCYEHINLIASKVLTTIDAMKRLKFKLDRKALEIIYFSFIRPVLEKAGIIYLGIKETQVQIFKY